MSALDLSNRPQNDFIGAYDELVQKTVMDEIEHAKYFSIIVDATLDSAHIEQTTFIYRYLTHITGKVYQNIKSRKDFSNSWNSMKTAVFT